MIRLTLAAGLALSAAPAAAVEWTPIASARLLGGAHRASGSPTVLSGNADGSLAASGELSDAWIVIPSARAAYQGTRRAADVIGMATPAQESLEARVAARGIWSPAGSPWRLKPGASYKLGWLKETRDERWGKGLFDERLWTLGGEAELADAGSALRVSLDWFDASYPNYTSLESQAALQFGGQPLARELVGDRVLDRSGLRAGVAAERTVAERVRLEATASTVWSRYSRQRVVDEGGQLSGGLRQDFLTSAALAARMPRDFNADLRALGSFTLGASFLSSNQNGYDAARGRFIGRGYDWRELSVGPGVRVLAGPARRPVVVDLGLGWRRREYPNRPAQDGAGVYGASPLRVSEWTFTGSVSYPMSERASVLFTLERASASSNQRFERFYRYGYEATTALAGLRWEW